MLGLWKSFETCVFDKGCPVDNAMLGRVLMNCEGKGICCHKFVDTSRSTDHAGVFGHWHLDVV